MNEKRRHAVAATTLGDITVVAAGAALSGCYFADHRRRPDTATFGARIDTATDDPVLGPAVAQLEDYLAGRRIDVDVPTVTAGDEFSERVWAMLREIPFGDTTSYGVIAEKLGDRRWAQWVGRAVGSNPLCVVIPCHRVIGADGSLTGYSGGLDRKRHLLDLERRSAYLYK